jgi:DNA-directed RNA polymerase specialized sigma24 family protein
MGGKDHAVTTELVRTAVAGERASVRALVAVLAPVVQARVARMLLRRRAAGVRREVRQEILDLSQEVFAALFERDARVLRSWDPARGMSLANFVGLVAEREVASILRSGVRSPFSGDDLLSEAAALPVPAPATLEADLASRRLLERLLDALRARLSPLGLQMFRLLYAEERSVEEVCAAMSMRPDAVYAWKSRLSRLAVEVRRELEVEPDGPSRVARRSGPVETVSESGAIAPIPMQDQTDRGGAVP